MTCAPTSAIWLVTMTALPVKSSRLVVMGSKSSSPTSGCPLKSSGLIISLSRRAATVEMSSWLPLLSTSAPCVLTMCSFWMYCSEEPHQAAEARSPLQAWPWKPDASRITPS